MSRQRQQVRFEPSEWWRRLCWVTPQIALCGDLPNGTNAKRRELELWIDAGITHIVDTRLENNDERFVAAHEPDVGYTWVGVDDDGGRQPDAWFDQGVDGALGAISNPDGKVVIHCHMGVNRGPSMGFAALLATGMDAVEALRVIRVQRPIAAMLYADDAIGWWHRRQGSDASALKHDRHRVREWMRSNPIDTNWITSRIWRSESA